MTAWRNCQRLKSRTNRRSTRPALVPRMTRDVKKGGRGQDWLLAKYVWKHILRRIFIGFASLPRFIDRAVSRLHPPTPPPYSIFKGAAESSANDRSFCFLERRMEMKNSDAQGKVVIHPQLLPVPRLLRSDVQIVTGRRNCLFRSLERLRPAISCQP